MSTTTEPPSVDEAEDAGKVVVDQRMRQRRIAVRRDEGRRRRRRVLWMLAPVALLVDGLALAHTPLLDVDRVIVEGAQQTPPATVRWASGIDGGHTLLTLDANEAASRIERLPWIAEAHVERQWPSTAHIVVRERVPAALVDLAGSMTVEGGEDHPPALVDAHGRVLDMGVVAPATLPPGLILLTGLDTRLSEGGRLPASARPALELAVALSERLGGAVVSISVDLEATLSVGGIARFGSTDDLEAKLVALETALTDVDLSCVQALDLRVPTSLAVTRDGC